MRVLVLDIGGTAIKSAVFTETGEITKECEVQAASIKGADYLMQQLYDIIADYNGIDCIGISSTGQIDYQSGSVIGSTGSIPGWEGVRVRDLIQEKFHIPTVIENDVNAMAIGEAFYGKGVGYKDFLCLTYGTGVGGAIFLNGQIVHGSRSAAAEFGHILTHAGGKQCPCGASGCYEAYASTNALISNVRNAIGESWDGRTIFSKVHSEPKIKIAIEEWIEEIAYGLVSLIYVFNPNLIILGGGVMEQNELINSISSSVKRKLMPSFKNVKIMNSKFGNKSALYGAFHCALNQAFK